jgi:hypothetical protein
MLHLGLTYHVAWNIARAIFHSTHSSSSFTYSLSSCNCSMQSNANQSNIARAIDALSRAIARYISRARYILCFNISRAISRAIAHIFMQHTSCKHELCSNSAKQSSPNYGSNNYWTYNYWTQFHWASTFCEIFLAISLCKAQMSRNNFTNYPGNALQSPEKRPRQTFCEHSEDPLRGLLNASFGTLRTTQAHFSGKQSTKCFALLRSSEAKQNKT